MKKSLRYSLLLIFLSIASMQIPFESTFDIVLTFTCVGLMLILIPLAVFQLIRELKGDK